jgi:hypothetical protein
MSVRDPQQHRRERRPWGNHVDSNVRPGNFESWSQPAVAPGSRRAARSAPDARLACQLSTDARYELWRSSTSCTGSLPRPRQNRLGSLERRGRFEPIQGTTCACSSLLLVGASIPRNGRLRLNRGDRHQAQSSFDKRNKGSGGIFTSPSSSVSLTSP